MLAPPLPRLMTVSPQMAFAHCLVQESCPDQFDAYATCVETNKPRGRKEFVRQKCLDPEQALEKCMAEKMKGLH